MIPQHLSRFYSQEQTMLIIQLFYDLSACEICVRKQIVMEGVELSKERFPEIDHLNGRVGQENLFIVVPMQNKYCIFRRQRKIVMFSKCRSIRVSHIKEQNMGMNAGRDQLFY